MADSSIQHINTHIYTYIHTERAGARPWPPSAAAAAAGSWDASEGEGDE
jgi:hypothetical protein